MRSEASVGGILGELFSLLADAGRDVAIFTLVIGGVTALGILAGLTDTTAGTLNYGFAIDGTDSPASGAFDFVSAMISIFGTYLLLVRYLAVRGRLHAGGARFWHYLGMAILSVLAMILGLFLLVVPGIILAVRWSASSGYVIGARHGVTESLGSSWKATEGHGWSIFFAAVIVFIGVAVCAGVAGGISSAVSLQVGEVVSGFVEAAASAVFAGLGIAIYCLVSDEAHEISEVFA